MSGELWKVLSILPVTTSLRATFRRVQQLLTLFSALNDGPLGKFLQLFHPIFPYVKSLSVCSLSDP